MTREEVMEMAYESGMIGGYEGEPDLLERFAAIVAQAEREACAKVCDAVAQKMHDEGEGPTGYIAWVTDCAASIRTRSKT